MEIRRAATAVTVVKTQQQGPYDLAANLFLLGVAEPADGRNPRFGIA